MSRMETDDRFTSGLNKICQLFLGRYSVSVSVSVSVSDEIWEYIPLPPSKGDLKAINRIELW